ALQSLQQIGSNPSLPRAIRLDAISALGFAANPSKASIEGLKSLAQAEDPEIRAAALLAVGTASFNLGKTSDPLASSSFEYLEQATRAARLPEERIMLIGALANTANPAATEIMEDALRSGEPQVREAATLGLRINPDARADTLLSERLLQDPSPEVRQG